MLSRTEVDRRFIFIFTGAFLGLVLSKGLALFPGYALDDYVAVHQDRNPLFYISQGRFTQALIQLILSNLGVTPTAIAWPVVCLFFIFAALAISSGLLYLTQSKGDKFGLACVAALIGAHPYLTEYFTFRESLITQCLSFGLLSIIFISILSYYQNAKRTEHYYSLIWVSLPMLILAGAQQTAFIILAFFLLSKFALDVFSHEGVPRLMRVLRGNSPVLFAFLVAVVVYVAIFMLTRNLNGAPSDGRSSLISSSKIVPRIGEVMELSKKIIFFNEPVLSRNLKLLLLLIIAIFSARICLKKPKTALVTGLIFVLLYLGSILLVTISGVWWPVPRAVYGVSFAYGITLAFILVWLEKDDIKYFSTGIILVAIGFAFHSSAILHDQSRLNRWDLWVAGEIARDLMDRDINSNQRVILVGAGWGHPVGLKTVDGDLNVSALSVSWAAKHLMMEATGRIWNIESVPNTDECLNSAIWPAHSSIIMVRDSVLVCMGKR